MILNGKVAVVIRVGRSIGRALAQTGRTRLVHDLSGRGGEEFLLANLHEPGLGRDCDGRIILQRPCPLPENQEEASMNVKVFNHQGQLVGVDVAKVVKTDAEWASQLTSEQYQIARGKGTERPFCGNLLDNKRPGVYACVCCGLPLFESGGKFNSGTGWPSFFRPIAEENVVTHDDRSHGMVRKEILCARCDAHLGHVFDDGPTPTRLRFCVNSESLSFTDEAELANLADPAAESVR